MCVGHTCFDQSAAQFRMVEQDDQIRFQKMMTREGHKILRVADLLFSDFIGRNKWLVPG